MTKRLFIGITIIVFACNLYAQDQFKDYISAGLEAQQYPTGYILGACAEFGITSHHSLDIRLGFNFVDHRDLGVHQNEEGGGGGMSIGYRYYFKPANDQFFIGARTDLWFNEIDWEDEPPNAGTTNITVFQPTAFKK